MTNAIFQYMVINNAVDTERGRVGEWKRSDLYKEVARISRESFEKYAKIVGADHIYSDEAVYTKGETTNVSLLFECLRVIYDEEFDKYDKVLFVDTDVVANTTDNIFEVSEAEVCGVYESDIVTGTGGGYNAWDFNESTYKDYINKFAQHGIEPLPYFGKRNSKLTIVNTGVIIWTKEARLKAREVFMDWKEWAYKEPSFHMSIMNDQPFISAMFSHHDFDFESIEQTWNDSPHYQPYDEFFKSNFLHYTGGDMKLLMMNDYRNGKFKFVE